jgi:hypothetical protein
VADETGPQPVDRDEVMFSNLAKHWLEARDTVESFANKYFAPANRDKAIPTSEWLQDSARFATQMWSLWLRGIAIMTEEGARLARRAEEQADKGQSGSSGS